jgi:hypothetical protein
MKPKKNNLKYFLFSILPLLILIFIIETGLRTVYYQKNASHTFAISYGIDLAKHRLIKKRAKNAVNSLIKKLNRNYLKQDIVDRLPPHLIDEKIHQALYSEIGEKILSKLMKEYEKHFNRLILEAKKIKSKIVILYIPTAEDRQSKRLRICRSFFYKLADAKSVDFIDLTNSFYRYPYHWVTLFPENHHLSRFGNILVASALSKYIENYGSYQSRYQFDRRSVLLGDLPKSLKEHRAKGTSLEYMLFTNKQGLRMNYDLSFPKKKQRVLILGDSFTYGPYLPNQQTFSGILESRYRDKEIINAGVDGYTIADELDLFVENARYTEPDITVLQVTDNDIYGMIFFKKQLFNRKKKNYLPSVEESEFLKSIRFDTENQQMFGRKNIR